MSSNERKTQIKMLHTAVYVRNWKKRKKIIAINMPCLEFTTLKNNSDVFSCLLNIIKLNFKFSAQIKVKLVLLHCV